MKKVHRGSIFAALAGTRVPSRHVLSAIVSSWNGDITEWLAKRSALENALATAHQIQQQHEQTPRPPRTEVTFDRLERSGVPRSQLVGGPDEQAKPSKDAVVSFAETLQALRFRYGNYSADQLSQETGLSRSAIYRAFDGKYFPSLKTVQALVRVLAHGDPAEVQAFRKRWLAARWS
jgi:DNA-binding XRE family transcriptional regulator